MALSTGRGRKWPRATGGSEEQTKNRLKEQVPPTPNMVDCLVFPLTVQNPRQEDCPITEGADVAFSSTL